MCHERTLVPDRRTPLLVIRHAGRFDGLVSSHEFVPTNSHEPEEDGKGECKVSSGCQGRPSRTVVPEQRSERSWSSGAQRPPVYAP